MAELTSRRRKALPKRSFAIPEDRAYPIHDAAHARAALARVAQHGTPEEQRRVRAAVARRYPEIEASSDEGEERETDRRPARRVPRRVPSR